MVLTSISIIYAFHRNLYMTRIVVQGVCKHKHHLIFTNNSVNRLLLKQLVTY